MGHRGKPMEPIRCKCLLRGACPEQSCINILACRLGMSRTSTWNDLEGTDSSMRFSESNLGDLANKWELASFKSAVNFCLTADLLKGSFLRLRRKTGNRASRLDPSTAAFLATLSAASLPWIPSCPGIHRTCRGQPGNLVQIRRARRRK